MRLGFFCGFKCALLDRQCSKHALQRWPSPFAEVVLFREAISRAGKMVGHRRQRKADPRCRLGIFMELAERTNEFIVGDKTGTYLTRSVRQLPASGAASGELLRSLVSTPWGPSTGTMLGRPKRHKNTQMMTVSLPQATPIARCTRERPATTLDQGEAMVDSLSPASVTTSLTEGAASAIEFDTREM